MTAPHTEDTAPLTHGDVVVLDYLAALWAESGDLPPGLRDELMSTVTQYIAVRRSAVSDPIDDVVQVIGRLGPPEALVASARRGHIPAHLRLPALVRAPAPMARRQPAGGLEYASIAMITGGSFVLPVIGPFAGMLLASGSPRWTPAQKATAWVLTAGSAGLGVVLLLATAALQYPSGAMLLALLAVIGGPVVAGLLLIQALGTSDPR